MTDATHLDVLIVGAGLSGIDAAVHISQAFPSKNYALLEQRSELGGTWSLFKYPGIRSDSDMYTLGFGFRPWTGKDAIGDGADILQYLKETATEYGVDQKIRYNRKATKYSWSTEDKRWTVTVENTETGATETLTASFLFSTSGYYNYDAGYTPDWPGFQDFKGQVIHPQAWPEDLDYTGKRVVVIGSGATAVTLIPSMAREAGHVTMLQRTPTWIVSQPKIDPVAQTLKKTLPAAVAAKAIHARYAAITIGFYEFCIRNPRAARAILKRWAKIHLPKDFDYDTHLTAPYDPWQQRLCVVPGADLFKAIHSHKVDIVTDHIEQFTETGILLKSGKVLEADIVVTATGLDVVAMGKAEIEVDGEKVDLGKSFTYKALMLSDIPNFAFVIGYSNASWTLKADLVCQYVVRLLEHMDETNTAVVTPRINGELEPQQLFGGLQSGYLARAEGKLPVAGDRDPWRLKHNWYFDKKFLRKSKVDDGVLEFH
ncbi:flavin-containing monooxygenase [Nocardioides cavernaquae]|uniref:NAD(P)/FAD-dependent oxidoreductase n=1 Tax=Nocardioides cavernaquae TaxID=2321396 RepID=A0A3A5HHJ3_9ACTN|nr:NAD(P)/FAD-dependent oxidoreductase [Nocardioides cavernaquae]RJS47534.1 NAD(P)/FAD-dependent oxidoreductase [Nocardioides cavernaquae]